MVGCGECPMKTGSVLAGLMMASALLIGGCGQSSEPPKDQMKKPAEAPATAPGAPATTEPAPGGTATPPPGSAPVVPPPPAAPAPGGKQFETLGRSARPGAL